MAHLFSSEFLILCTPSHLTLFHESRLKFLQLDRCSKCYNYCATRTIIDQCATIPINEGYYSLFSVILICPKLAKNLFIQGQGVFNFRPSR
jgi:hypothetical protein